jgi:hypothetical protein
MQKVLCKFKWQTSAPNSPETESVSTIHASLHKYKLTRLGQADLSVHVSTVHIDLTTVVVDSLANFFHGTLKDTVGGRISDHDARQLLFVLFGLCLKIRNVDVTLFIAVNRDDLQTNHHSTSRVGTVSRDRDQYNVTVSLAVGLLILTNSQETSILSLRTSVGLQRDGVEASDVSQLTLEVVEHLLVSLGLIDRNEGVNAVELGPSDGDHFSSSVQFHGARAQRNHGVHETQVLVVQAEDVTQHLVFGVVAVEHGVSQVSALSVEVGGDGNVGLSLLELVSDVGALSVGLSENVQQSSDIVLGGSLVDGDGDSLVVQSTDVDTVLDGKLLELSRSALGQFDADSIEVRSFTNFVAQLLNLSGDHVGLAVDVLSNGTETLRTVVDGVPTLQY